MFYGIFLVLTVDATLAGATIDVGVGKATTSLPIFLPFLTLVAACELWRLASYRSTLYRITAEGFTMSRGILDVKVRLAIPRARIVGVALERSEPALVTDQGPVRLAGLHGADADALRVALGLPEEHVPFVEKPRRRELVLALVTLVVLVLAHVDAAIARSQRTRFDALSTQVETALVQAQKRFMADHGGGALYPMNGHTLLSPFFSAVSWSAEAKVVDMSARRPDDPSQPALQAAVGVRHGLAWGLLAWHQEPLVVSELEPASGNEELLRDLKDELGKLGIDAVWPSH
jgi:hypothetical protein